MSDVTTGIRLEAVGADDYKTQLLNAAKAGDDLEQALQQLEAAEGDSADKTKALNGAVKILGQESKTLKARLKAVESSFDASSSAEEQAAQKKEVLNEQITTQRAYIALLTEQLKEMTESTDADALAVEKQQEKIYKAAAALNDMEAALRETDSGMDEAASSADELSGSLDGASGNAGSFKTVFSANLVSDAVIKGMETVASLAEKIGGAMLNAAKGAAQYADDVQTLSVQTGIGTDTLQEYQYMADLLDVPLTTVTNDISRLIPKMSEAADATTGVTLTQTRLGESAKESSEDLAETESSGSKAADIFRELGVKVTEADGSLRDSHDVFLDVIDALGQIENPTERDAITMELFGKKAQELNPLIEAGSEGIKAFAEQAHDMGYVLDEEALSKLGELQNAFDTLDNTVQTIQNRFGLGLAGALTTATSKLGELALSADWESLGESVGTVLGDLVGDLVELAENTDLSALGQKIENGFSWLAENGERVASIAEAIGIGFAGWSAVSAIAGASAQAKELLGWLEKVGALLGIGGAGAAAGTVGIVAGVAAIWDRVNENKTRGTLGEGKELEEYAANVEQAAAALAQAQLEFDQTAEAGGDLTMVQDQLDTKRIALQNATAEYEAAKKALEENGGGNASGGSGASDTQETAAAAAQAAEDYASAEATILQNVARTTGEISTAFVEGTDEMSQGAVAAVEATESAMEQNMALLEANAYIWGVDMMVSLANGIVDGSNTFVLRVVDDLAEDIKKRLGFSEPEIGPLSDFHTYAPDMMQLFAKGIRDGRGLIEAAIGSSFDLGPMIAARNDGAPTMNYGGVSVVINAAPGQSADELYDVFSYRLARDIADRRQVFST